jgi:hypothetical protein
MGQIIQKEHHGRMVSADIEFSGRHRDICLCYRCKKFTIPRERKPTRLECKFNCGRAAELFEFVVKNGMVCPVLECPDFEPNSIA